MDGWMHACMHGWMDACKTIECLSSGMIE